MYSSKHSSCRFCELASATTNDVRAHDLPWMVSDSYRAIASIGALVPGWSLIVPRDHTLNMAGEFGSRACLEFISEAANRLASEFGDVVVFEHGCTSEISATGCGTGHAHLHLVPLVFDLVDEAVQFDPAMEWVNCKITDVRERSQGCEYLFVANQFRGTDTSGKLCRLSEGRSQFFRRVVARALGSEDQYNYREYSQMANVMETISRMTQHCAMAA